MKSLRAGVLGALCVTALLAAAPANSPVADAARRGDREAVRTLVKQGEDVNAPTGDGMTALHWAAINDDVEMAEVLIYAGANLEAVTRIGAHRPLHVASRAGNTAVVKRLLEAGADATATTSTGVTALHFAAAAGTPEIVTALVDAGADVNATDPAWLHTPLMVAAAQGRGAAIRALMAGGADPAMSARLEATAERSAVDAAARRARTQVLTAFHEQAENKETWRPDPSQVQAAVRAARSVERMGVPPVGGSDDEPEYAGGRGGGGEGDSPSGGFYGGLTALLLAVREGSFEAVEALLDGGADVNQVREGDQTSPMLLAAINGHYDLVKYLLDRGGDPNVASTDGATPLYAVINKEWAPRSRHPQPTYHRQQKFGYLEVMEALLEGGADPNARLTTGRLWYTSPGQDNLGVDFRGATPFFRAAHGTDVPAMRLLVAYGADPTIPTTTPPPGEAGGRGGFGGRAGGAGDGPDPSGLPPVQPGGPGTPPIVVAAGAGYGLGYAANDHEHAAGGWLPTMRYLVEELGHDVNARDARGFTALHFAAARGDNQLILYLVEKGADVTAVARTGQTTADMANGPFQRISPYLDTVALLEKLGSHNNNNCVSC